MLPSTKSSRPRQARFRDEAIERLLRSQAESQVLREPSSLKPAVKQGFNLILGASVETIGVALTFDLLERQIDRDYERRLVYVPVCFFHGNKLTREDLLLAAFHGIILAEALGQPVPFVNVVHGPRFSVTKIKLAGPAGPTRLAKETRLVLGRLRKQVESTSPPLMILNSHCPYCEFRDRCHAEAVNKDDLSLMRGMSEKEMLAQRKHGISTVAQFACTFRPKIIGQRRSKPLKRHLHALQALAVRDKKVYVVRSPEVPTKTPRVYLDVEGLPDQDFHYLVGVLVEKDGRSSCQSFWADDDTDEQSIWVQLLNHLRVLGDCTIFHYGAYEKAYIKKMRRKYPSPDTPFSGTWDSALFNVLGAIRTNVYFPAHSNGLKDVASFLGVTWTGKVTSGIECIAARMRWEESKDPVIKEEIHDYNRQDCLAVQQVVQFLTSFVSEPGTTVPEVRLASEIIVESNRRFGKIEFAVPEMSFINKCARFDYQREKVILRTDPAVKASVRRKRARARSIQKPNADVRCEDAVRCPACGGIRVTSLRSYSDSKLVYDLKFTRTGVKRWVVRYFSKRRGCLECKKSFFSDSYPTNQVIGHALASWAVYKHVALRQSFDDITCSVNDVFGYSFTYQFGAKAQIRLAEIHQQTLDKMLELLRLGVLIHADETKINIRSGTIGYIWALSDSDIVVYFYHPTREGTFLKETLGDFAGVLVSDFYAAYDSVTCHQQKCHLHLMRDINDDLLKHPFDEELKELAKRYTFTLKPMVETIDKHGLKTKFLSRHKRKCRRFPGLGCQTRGFIGGRPRLQDPD